MLSIKSTTMLTLSVLSIAIATANPAHAAPPSGASTNDMSAASAAMGTGTAKGAHSAEKMSGSRDHGFVDGAAKGGMAEVAMSQLAQEKASSDAVKQYAAKMVEDHTKANDELKQLASTKGAALPLAPASKEMHSMDHLKGLSGAQFDKQYMAHMVADHKKMVALFQKESTSGKDSDLKAFATKTLPTLQSHLQMAQETRATLSKGGAKTASAAK